MGFECIFHSSLADFTEIGEGKEVYLSDVLQQTSIAVDEEGTEAAAGLSKHFAGI